MTGNEWIAPTITGALGLVVALISAYALVKNGRTGATERRAPTAAEAWAETDRARARMHAFEDRFWSVLAALKHLVRSIRQQHPDFTLTDDVVEALKTTAPEDDLEP